MKNRTSFATVVWVALMSCASYRQDLSIIGCPAGSGVADDSCPSSVQGVLNEIVREGVPGVVLSVLAPNGSYDAAAGYAKIEGGVPMATCHLQYLQSVSKTFTAVAVLQLHEQHRVELDSPIANFLPAHIASSVPGVERVTVRMLLNHTSGLPEYNYAPKYISILLQQPHHRFEPVDYLTYIKNKPLDFEPGTRYSYRNANYVVLALMIDYLTGDHAKYIEDGIIRRLQLKHTHYRGDSAYLNYPTLVNTYWDRYSNGIVENVSQLQRNNVAAMVGDDGIVCTPHDAVVFLRGLMEGALISRESLTMMMQWVNDANGNPTYGLGLDYATMGGFNGYGHSGGGIGAGCQLYYFPDRNTYIFVGINLGTVTESPLHAKPMAGLERLYKLLLGGSI